MDINDINDSHLDLVKWEKIPFRIVWNSTESKKYAIKEIKKILIALVYLVFGIMSNAFSSVLVLEKHLTPDEADSLPDVILDRIGPTRVFGVISERVMMVIAFLTICFFVFSQNGWKIARRYLTVIGIVYFIRSIAVYITSIPVPNPDFARENCHKEGLNYFQAFIVAFKFVFIYGGFTANGVVLCGDLIISGHTCVLTSWAYIWTKYTKKNVVGIFLLALIWCFYIFSEFSILAAHNHYSIDVFLAVVICWLSFGYYHLHAELLQTKKAFNEGFSIWKCFLLPFFRFLEEDEVYPFNEGFVFNPFKGFPLSIKRNTKQRGEQHQSLVKEFDEEEEEEEEDIRDVADRKHLV